MTQSPTRSPYASFGAVAVTGTPPFDGSTLAAPFLEAGKALGEHVASTAMARKAGEDALLSTF